MSNPIEDGDRTPLAMIFALVLMGIALLGAMAAVWFVSNPGFKLPIVFPRRHAEAPLEPPPKAVTSADGHLVSNPDWRRKPTAEDIERYYPQEAERKRVAGRVVINCKVARDTRLAGCKVEAETPTGWGFGDAAVRMASQFRMYPKTVDGQPTDAGDVRVPINFEPER